MNKYMSTYRNLACLAFFALIFASTSCSCPPEPTNSPLSVLSIPGLPAEQPVPDQGMAAVSGLLYSFSVQRSIAGTVFYLSPGEGPEHNEPPVVFTSTSTDERGIRGISNDVGGFVVNNVPPGNYFLVVWAPYDWIIATESDTDLTPRLIELDADERLNLGVVYLPWP